jgi:hypothetical protein
MATPVLVAIRMIQWLAPFFAYHYFTGDPGIRLRGRWPYRFWYFWG